MLYFFTMVGLLTLLTQTGGVILIVAYGLWKWFKWDTAFVRLGSFMALYIITSMIVLPLLAPGFGKLPLPWRHETLRPHSWITVLCNRHYVDPKLYEVLLTAGQEYQQQYPGRKLVYLDAGFPLGEKFPLPPHKSHYDGKAIDMAFAYSDRETQQAVSKAPNWLGYGRYEPPKDGEPNWPKDCVNQGNWWYGVPRWLALRPFEDIIVADEATRTQIRLFADNPAVTRIFLEPHLKQRWYLMGKDRIRFHGCKAMRHDDHYHLSVR